MAEVTGKYFDDLDIGEVLETGKRIVTKEDVLAFAELTGDDNPLHMDERFAKRTIFGQQIAHGMLTASINTGLVAQLGIFHGTVIAFLEVNARFLAPVFFGDEIMAKCRVTDKIEENRPNRGIIKFLCEVVNQNDKIVAETEWKLILKRKRPPAE